MVHQQESIIGLAYSFDPFFYAWVLHKLSAKGKLQCPVLKEESDGGFIYSS